MEITKTPFLRGKIQLYQYKDGYRFSIDSILLAFFPEIKKNVTNVVDMGTGSGILSIILALRFSWIRVTAIEIQEELVSIAKENVNINRLSDRINIIHGDFRQVEKYIKKETVDVIISNPPYLPKNTGRSSPKKQKAIAKHELKGRLEDVADAANYILKQGGELDIVYPVHGLKRMIMALEQRNLKIERLRMIHENIERAANLFLLCAKKDKEAIPIIPPPLIIRDTSGNYTKEVNDILEGKKLPSSE